MLYPFNNFEALLIDTGPHSFTWVRFRHNYFVIISLYAYQKRKGKRIY